MDYKSSESSSTEHKVRVFLFALISIGLLLLTNHELINFYGIRGSIPTAKFWLEKPAKYTLDGVMFDLLVIIGTLFFRGLSSYGTTFSLICNVAGVIFGGWAVWGLYPPVLIATILGALIYVVELLLSDSGSSWDRNRLLIFLGNKKTRFTPNRYRFALIGLPFVGASMALAIYKHQFPNCIPSIWVAFPLVIAFGVRQIDIALTRNQYGTRMNTNF
jgi:hypothetical protein